jgi:hypothetical protein
MLYDPRRHEALRATAWDEAQARAAIERIVRDIEARFSADALWPIHPRDADDGGNDALTPLYFGACGVYWALHYLEAVGAARLARSYAPYLPALLSRNRAWLGEAAEVEAASYLMGDTPILLLSHWLQPSADTADRLQALIAGNLDHPARELMWGSPGTMLAALFLHEHTGEPRWAELFRATARRLWSQLQWSPEHQCHYWTQDLYGTRSTYLDAVHGFVATASPLIRGRHLLDDGEWAAWQTCIANTITRTASVEGALANWRAHLVPPVGRTPKLLMQFCHGAPGFVVCLGDFPGSALDALLIAGGEATWAAGPLAKGSNLCHGTGGNGYTFLKLYRRTGDALWLQRARAFAMHGIAQTESDAQRHGQMRYSLWTGDPGFAIYLWDCIHVGAAFPTLDVFFPAA